MGKAIPSNRSSSNTISNKRKWNGLLVGHEICEWDWFDTHFLISYFRRSQFYPFPHIHCLSRMHSSFVHRMMCVEGVFIVIYGYVCAEPARCRQQTQYRRSLLIVCKITTINKLNVEKEKNGKLYCGVWCVTGWCARIRPNTSMLNSHMDGRTESRAATIERTKMKHTQHIDDDGKKNMGKSDECAQWNIPTCAIVPHAHGN